MQDTTFENVTSRGGSVVWSYDDSLVVANGTAGVDEDVLEIHSDVNFLEDSGSPQATVVPAAPASVLDSFPTGRLPPPKASDVWFVEVQRVWALSCALQLRLLFYSYPLRGPFPYTLLLHCSCGLCHDCRGSPQLSCRCLLSGRPAAARD